MAKTAIYHALCALQAALGVEPDGQVGPDTLRALERSGAVIGGRRRQPSSAWDADPPTKGMPPTHRAVMCDCSCATPCPQGRRGAQARCTIWVANTPEGP